MNIVLISTYDLGHQPFGLASPKAWLVREGHDVGSADLAVDRLSDETIQAAGLVAFYLPMHTATRLALPVIARVKLINASAKMIAYGLYAPLNAELLKSHGVDAIAGGEFEAALVKFARGEQIATVSLDRLDFILPDRSGLIGKYAMLRHGAESKRVAYTEASRGCKHMCRHCPIVPVYQGKFRVVSADVVLADIRQQIASGAQHVTFGDPDFFNGPAHALRIVEALHREFPDVTYDAIIKVEHLLRHRYLLETLRETGCLFITSAVESLDDAVLAKLEKHHTRANFIEAVRLTRDAGLMLQPTFIAFTPWTTHESYRDLLQVLAELNLVENVPPVQLALRLLVTSGSRLLELDDLRVEAFDSKSLVYPWKHPDPQMDLLAAQVFKIASESLSRAETFRRIASLVHLDTDNFDLVPRAAVPYLDEPWYC